MKKILLFILILLTNNSFSNDVILVNEEDLNKREFEFIKQTRNQDGKILFKSCYIESADEGIDTLKTECQHFIGDEGGYSNSDITRAIHDYEKKLKVEYVTDAALFGLIFAANFVNYKRVLSKNTKRYSNLNKEQISWLKTHNLNTPSVLQGTVAIVGKSFLIDDSAEYIDILKSIQNANDNDLVIVPIKDQSIKSIKNRLSRALYDIQ